jgi:hypothetical protein
MAAITAAQERNEEFIAAGKAAFHQASIEEFGGGGRRFDVIFAVNVNLFWIDAAKGLDPVRRLLTKNGRLLLFYEPPSPAQGERIARQLAGGISANGFELVATHEADPGGGLLGVTARRV